MYYGVKTGLNEAFIIDQATRDRLVRSDPRCVEIIKAAVENEVGERFVQLLHTRESGRRSRPRTGHIGRINSDAEQRAHVRFNRFKLFERRPARQAGANENCRATLFPHRYSKA